MILGIYIFLADIFGWNGSFDTVVYGYVGSRLLYESRAGMHALALDSIATVDHWAIGKIFLADLIAWNGSFDSAAYGYVGAHLGYERFDGMHALALDITASIDHWSIEKYF